MPVLGAPRLIRAIQDLSLAHDFETIRTLVRTAARELVGADGAAFVVRDRDCCYYADEDAIGPLWKGQRFPMSACISGWSMLHGEPAVVPDVFLDTRVPIEAYKPTFVKSLVVVPIREAEPLGAIGVYWAHVYCAPDLTVQLLQALANSTAVAMENVRICQELERRVQERTAQLEEANRGLDAFSHSVSHDLRAPLRHVCSFARLLQEHAAGSFDEESRRYMDRIVSSAERMSQLIDDLLAFARLGKAALNKHPVDLREVVCVAQADAMLEAASRAIHWNIEDCSLVVFTDPALLRQALVNLLTNAVKYTRGRSPALIEVGARRVAERNETVVFVRDNGAGFDPKYADRLFGEFERLHSSTEFEGTGLGLASVRRIIQRHGGRIWAEGAPGHGATFWFALPNPDSNA